MDSSEIDPRLLKAGKEFGAALAKLGLDAHALFWGFDRDLGHHVLVLVTDYFDLKGPLAISKALFRAYNASATPKEIDPFTVRLHSLNQAAGRHFVNYVTSGWAAKKVDQRTKKPVGEPLPIKSMRSFGVEFQPEWIIEAKRPEHPRKAVELNRRWARFQRNIDQLAA